MNCQQVNEHLFKYCDNQLPPELTRKIELHLKSCPNCRAMLELTQIETQVIMNGSGIPSLPEDFTAQIMGKVNPDNKVQPVAGIAKLRQNTRLLYTGLTMAGAAAVLLIALTWPPGLNQVQLADNSNNTGSQTSIKSTADKDELKTEPKADSPAAGEDIVPEEEITPGSNTAEKDDVKQQVTENLPPEPEAQLNTYTDKISSVKMAPGEADTNTEQSVPESYDAADSEERTRILNTVVPIVKLENIPSAYKLIDTYRADNQREVFIYEDTTENVQVRIIVESNPLRTITALDAGESAEEKPAYGNSSSPEVNVFTRQVWQGKNCYLITSSGPLPEETLGKLVSQLKITIQAD